MRGEWGSKLVKCDDGDEEEDVWRDEERGEEGGGGGSRGEGERDQCGGRTGRGLLRICARPITSPRHITSSSWHYFRYFFFF